MDLHRQVLAAAERAADAGERHPDLVLGQTEDRGDLPQVGVEPLGRDVEVHAAVLRRHGETGLGSEERLVLHAEGVLAGDDDVGALRGLVGVAAHDRLAVHDVRVRHMAGVVVVAAGVQQRRVRRGRGGLVGDDGQLLVLDLDLGGGAARGLRVVGGDEGHGLAVVAYDAVGEDRGVLDLQTVVPHIGRQVVVGEYGVDAGLGERLRGVDGDDLGVRDRGAQDLAPQHVLVPHVGGVRELAGDLEGAVGPERGLADATLGLLGEVRGCAGGGHRQTLAS